MQLTASCSWFFVQDTCIRVESGLAVINAEIK